MQSIEQDLNYTGAKIKRLEENIVDLQDAVSHYADQLKETQKFLIKLAHNQAELTKRISAWPYIVVADDSEEA